MGRDKQGAQIMSEGSVFDFRSDTVTRPDEAMRSAMAVLKLEMTFVEMIKPQPILRRVLPMCSARRDYLFHPGPGLT